MWHKAQQGVSGKQTSSLGRTVPDELRLNMSSVLTLPGYSLGTGTPRGRSLPPPRVAVCELGSASFLDGAVMTEMPSRATALGHLFF